MALFLQYIANALWFHEKDCVLKINKHGFGIIAIELLLLVISCFAISVFSVAATAACILFFVLFVFTVYFFRDPERRIPDGKGIIVSPADGRVVEIVQEREDQFCDKEMVRISIFLNIFNVHVNRMPVAGSVRFIRRVQGRFFHAASHKASLDNEQTMVGIETGEGVKILVKQIAGFIARRIVCYAKINDGFSIGQRFGIIKFGSRTDIFVPVHTRLNVVVGDKVHGGTTILGTYEQL